MKERTTTVNVDEQGRLYLPKAVRESLNIKDMKATVELDVRVLERGDDDE